MPRTFKATVILIVFIGLLLVSTIFSVVQNCQMTGSVQDLAGNLEEVNRTMTEISEQLEEAEQARQEHEQRQAEQLDELEDELDEADGDEGDQEDGEARDEEDEE